MNSTGIGDYSSAFGLKNLLIRIGYQGVDANWQTVVSTYGDSVLGYMIDEPWDKVSASSIQSIAGFIHGYGSTLWLDDYDTGMMPYDYPCYSRHQADWSALNSCDYLMCDADNSGNTNGSSICGTWLAQNYNAFLGSEPPTPVFNTIYTTPPYYSEGDVTSWMDDHISRITTFALYLNSGYSWSDVDEFAQYAYQAGYLGEYEEQFQAEYTCDEDGVEFNPGTELDGSYWGVWSGTGYTGPVDPSTTPGAVECWTLTEWNPLNQYQTLYAR